MYLYVDDERTIPEGWTGARTYAQAIETLINHEVEIISLDHDLGEEKTGYDIANWLEERQFFGWPIPKMILCHSGNPSGKINIMRAVDKINERRPK